MKKRGFTLIELLIVVAIIAILAAIAVPNFLEAQTRSKVARVKSDHRSLATAVESYYVDNNEYPAMTGASTSLATAPTADMAAYRTAPTTGVGRTFRARNTTSLLTLTTPIAYITSTFPDPFADTKGIGFRYYSDGPGWILGSWGPDVDEAAGGDLAWNVGDLVVNTDLIETVYNNTASSQPSTLLVTGAPTAAAGRGAFTYDPTNGTISDGDVYRVRQ